MPILVWPPAPPPIVTPAPTQLRTGWEVEYYLEGSDISHIIRVPERAMCREVEALLLLERNDTPDLVVETCTPFTDDDS